MASSTVSPPAGKRSLALPITLLVAVFGAAFDVMYGQFKRSGYFDFIDQLLNNGGNLPGSDRPLKQVYSGVAGFDRLLAMGNAIFVNVTDGSRPELSLYAIQFGGQIVPFFLVMVIEGLRVGSRTNAIRGTVLWGIAVQTFGFGVVMPIYCIVHLLTTSNRPVLDTVLLRDNVPLRAVIPAFVLGYYLPGALMSYPFPDNNLRQVLNATWQGFPLHVVVITLVASVVTKHLSIGADAHTSRAQLDRRALGSAYRFALIAGTLTQWLVYYVTFTSAIYAHLFPGDMAQSFTPDKVFLPGSVHSLTKMVSPAVAMHDFLIFDQIAGATATMIWAITLSWRAGRTTVDGKLVMSVLRNCVLVGPGGAVVMLMMQRDDAALAAAETK